MTIIGSVVSTLKTMEEELVYSFLDIRTRNFVYFLFCVSLSVVMRSSRFVSLGFVFVLAVFADIIMSYPYPVKVIGESLYGTSCTDLVFLYYATVAFWLAVDNSHMVFKYLMDNRHKIRLNYGLIPDEVPYQSERVMPGSNFQQVKDYPKFQAGVYTLVNDKLVPRGQGFLVKKEWFVTAQHVVGDDASLVLKSNAGECVIQCNRFQQREGDISVVRLTAQELGRLQLAQASLYQFAQTETRGTMVSVQAFGKQSMGQLGNHEGFGFVTYTGSTLPGFSGAPYYFGNIVYGMHTGGMAQNIGYESAYLDMLFRKAMEDSAEYLIETARNGMRFEYDRSPYSPDEYRVVMGGRYHVIDEDILNEMLREGNGRQMSAKVRDEADYDPERFELVDLKKLKLRRRPIPRPKYIPEGMENDAVKIPLVPRGSLSFDDSENSKPAGVAPASVNGKSKEIPESALSRLSTRLESLERMSQKQSAISDMIFQTLMHVQQNVPSASTPVDSNQSKPPPLGVRQSKALLSALSRLTDIGEQTLAQRVIQTLGLSVNSPQPSVK